MSKPYKIGVKPTNVVVVSEVLRRLLDNEGEGAAEGFFFVVELCRVLEALDVGAADVVLEVGGGAAVAVMRSG